MTDDVPSTQAGRSLDSPMPGECRADRTEIASGNVPLYYGWRTEYGILLLYGFKENHDKEN